MYLSLYVVLRKEGANMKHFIQVQFVQMLLCFTGILQNLIQFHRKETRIFPLFQRRPKALSIDA